MLIKMLKLSGYVSANSVKYSMTNVYTHVACRHDSVKIKDSSVLSMFPSQFLKKLENVLLFKKL